MDKRFEGRDEPILDSDIPIIDAHHHLFDRPGQRYLLDEYFEDASAGHPIVASVYVETQAMARADGPVERRPLGEVEFANGIAAMSASGVYGDVRACAAIIGHADLRAGAQVGAVLDLAMSLAHDRFRGIRQTAADHPSDAPFKYFTHRPPRGILAHAKFREGFRQLVQRGLSFDAAVFHHQLDEIGGLADAFPDAVIVLNHMGIGLAEGMGARGREQAFPVWRQVLATLALRPNVYCKVGGLGLPFWGFELDARSEPIGYAELASLWRPYVETAIEAFTPSRCMLESNYPPDARSCGFVPLWNSLKHIIAGCSRSEKADMLHGTASRVYRIPLSR